MGNQIWKCVHRSSGRRGAALWSGMQAAPATCTATGRGRAARAAAPPQVRPPPLRPPPPKPMLRHPGPVRYPLEHARGHERSHASMALDGTIVWTGTEVPQGTAGMASWPCVRRLDQLWWWAVQGVAAAGRDAPHAQPGIYPRTRRPQRRGSRPCHLQGRRSSSRVAAPQGPQQPQHRPPRRPRLQRRHLQLGVPPRPATTQRCLFVIHRLPSVHQRIPRSRKELSSMVCQAGSGADLLAQTIVAAVPCQHASWAPVMF